MEQRVVTAAEFKAKCLRLMDEVNESGEALLIIKRGKPVARLLPAVPRRRTLWGAHEGEIEVLGDIVSPALDGFEAIE